MNLLIRLFLLSVVISFVGAHPEKGKDKDKCKKLGQRKAWYVMLILHDQWDLRN